MIRRVLLVNFRQHVHSDVPFSDGINTISGGTGRGKTTIIEAIEWAFYGKVKKGTTVASIRSRFAAPDAEVLVRVEFESGGHEYWVERRLTASNNTTAKAGPPLEDGRDRAKGSSGVSDFVTKLFGVGHQAFVASFVARQKELDAMTGLTAEKRRQFFIRMMGLQAMDKAKPFIRKDMNTALDTANALKGQMPDLAGVRAALKAAKSEHASLVRAAKQAVKDEEAAVKRSAKAKQSAKSMDLARSEHMVLSGQRSAANRGLMALVAEESGLASAVSGLDAELEGYVPVGDIGSEIEKLGLEVAAYRSIAIHGDAVAEASLNERALLSDIASRLAEAASITAALPALPGRSVAETPAITARLAEVRGQMAPLVKHLAELDDFTARVSAGEVATCPVCYTDLSSGEEALSHVRERSDADRGDIAALSAEEAVLVASLAEARVADEAEAVATKARSAGESRAATLVAEAEAMRPQAEKETSRRGAAEASLAAVPTDGFSYGDLAETEAVLSGLKAQKDRNESMRTKAGERDTARGRLDRLRSDISAAEEGLASVEAAMSALGFDQAAYAATEAASEDAETAHREATSSRSDAEHAVTASETGTASLQADLDKGTELAGKVDGFRQNAATLSTVDTVVTMLRADLAQRIAPRIAEYTSRLLREVTDGLYQNVTLDEDYNAYVIVDDEEWPAAQFSGGETDVLNLCMRLAISQMLLEARGLPSSMLILDEVFGSQDEDKRMAIIDAVVKLKSVFPQIILVTHIPEIKERSDRIIEIERVEGKGSIVVGRAA